MNDPQPLLEIRDAGKTYAGGVEALRGVDLCAGAGEIVVLMGPSGSGKSTLLHLIGALDRPTRGQIRVAGHDVGGASFCERTRYRLHGVGFVFQHFNLLPAFTLRENVELPLILAGHDEAERRRRLDDLAGTLGLEGCIDRFPHEVSGGQQQRAAIARALANRPPVLLADEPTATLDTANALQVFDLIRELVARSGMTAVVATHDTRLLTGSERVIQLVDGMIRTRTHEGDGLKTGLPPPAPGTV